MNDTTKNAIESLEEYKKGLLKSIAIAIQTTNGDDDYSVGLRNGLRVCKAYIDGLEPEYEKCKPSAPPNSSESPNGWIPAKINPPKEAKIYLIQTETGYMCLCRWTNDTTGFRNKYSEWRWHTMDKPQYSVVVAWMPLPAPYRPKEDES